MFCGVCASVCKCVCVCECVCVCVQENNGPVTNLTLIRVTSHFNKTKTLLSNQLQFEVFLVPSSLDQPSRVRRPRAVLYAICSEICKDFLCIISIYTL